MKLSVLKKSVIDLGFDTELEDDIAFVNTVNRALLEVNDIFPKIGVLSVYNKPLLNGLGLGENAFDIYYKDYNNTLEFSCNGARAYYFEANEKVNANSIKIEAYLGGEWITLKTLDLSSSEGGFQKYRGLVEYTAEQQAIEGFSAEDTEVKITFGGVYPYSVKNIALYTALLSPNVSDIPDFAPYIVVDVSTQTNFLGLTTDVLKSDGTNYTEYEDYFVENDKILIPYSSEGVFNIHYKKHPSAITLIQLENIETEDTDIDLSEDLAALLPELIASYLWLDGQDKTRAQRYYDLYKIRAAAISSRRKENIHPFSYKTRGWA